VSRPAITLSTAAQSAADRAIGPTVSNENVMGMHPAVLTTPNVGFTAVIPLKAAGMRMLPRASVPSAAGIIRAATAIPLPLLEPPGDSDRPHGLTPQWP
jgi:hypothetical protein